MILQIYKKRNMDRKKLLKILTIIFSISLVSVLIIDYKLGNLYITYQEYCSLDKLQTCIVSILILSFFIILFLLILSGYHFLKNNSEKLTMEQRLGIVVTILSIFPLLHYIIFYIIDEWHEIDEIFLYIGIILLVFGIVLIFKLFSSLVRWIKFGKK